MQRVIGSGLHSASAVRCLVIATIGGAAAVGCTASRVNPRAQNDVGAGDARDTPVGVRTMEVVAAGRAAFSARVWYPTLGGEPKTFRANAVLPGYQAVPDGAVALKSPAPLVILIHGSGGAAEGMAWI